MASKKELIIGFSRPKKWKPFSALIRWWDRVRYKSDIDVSHCYGRFHSSSWERDFIYQSAGLRSHFMGGHRFQSINECVEEYRIKVSNECLIKIGQVCIDREGKPYAIKQTFGLVIKGLVWLGTCGRKTIRNPFADGDAETNCIEEWGRILSQELNLDLPSDMDSSSVKPFRDWIRSLDISEQIDPCPNRHKAG